MDLLLTEPRAQEAAPRLLQRASRRTGVSEPIPLKGSDAQEATITSDTQEGTASVLHPVQD